MDERGTRYVRETELLDWLDSQGDWDEGRYAATANLIRCLRIELGEAHAVARAIGTHNPSPSHAPPPPSIVPAAPSVLPRPPRVPRESER